MTFLDEVEITLASGKGGNGSATFHREKHVPRGGPNGADGGKGGDVVLVADRHLRTLYEFKGRTEYRATDGEKAHGNKAGSDGKDLVIKVPIGTVVTDLLDGEVLADLGHEGQRFILCKGGRGGFGNLHYASSVRQTPTFAELGEPAEEARVRLELKLLADVGLVGLPNAGKSTLLGQVSRARPKVAAYPFTTITPNLGVVVIGTRSFVIADLPGLIEGASEGHGLGHQFLKHTERTKILIHVVDAFPLDETDPWENFLLIEEELRSYSQELYDRPRLIALNKVDLESMGDLESVKLKFEKAGFPLFVISGATGQGVQPLLYAVLGEIEKAEAVEVPIVLTPSGAKTQVEEIPYTVEFDGDEYLVKGRRIERMVNMTDLSNKDAVRHLHRRLEKKGIIEALKQAGCKDGDTVVIDNWEFEFSPW